MKRLFKTIGGFIIVLAIAGIAVWFTRSELGRLKTELGSIHRADKKFQLTANISAELGNYERLAVQYGNRPDAITRKLINATQDSLFSMITVLREKSKGKDYEQAVDSVEILFKDFTSKTRELILLKQAGNPNVEEQMISLISQTGDSLMQDSSALNLIRNRSTMMLLEQPVLVEVEKKKTDKRKKKQVEQETIDTLAQLPQAPVLKKIYSSETSSTDSLLITKIDSLFNRMQAEMLRLKEENQAFKKKISYRESSLAQKRQEVFHKLGLLLDGIREEEQAQLSTGISKAMKNSETVVDSLLWVIIIAAFLSFLFILNLGYDVAKSHYFQQQLQQAKKRAENLAQAREQFLSHMSHEIRTPLNAILGFSGLLETEPEGSRSRLFSYKIKGAVGHLLTLVNNVLDFSKLKSGNLRPVNVRFSPYDATIEVVSVMQVLAHEKGLFLEVNMEEDQIPEVKGDILWFKQVLYNLLGNAVKFTKEGGISLSVSAYKNASGQWVIKGSVQDTGNGISLEQQKRLFQPFESSHAEQDNERQAGTGLGLSITRDLVRLQGGEIWYQVPEGKGSVFCFKIPYQPISGRKKTGLQPPAHWLKDTVCMVVEDDKASQALFSELLKSWGAQVIKAASAEEGLEKLRQEKQIDLVICDQNLGKMKGSEMILQFHAEYPTSTTGFILSSAMFDPKKEKFPEAIEIKILPKPFHPEMLAAAIADMEWMKVVMK